MNPLTTITTIEKKPGYDLASSLLAQKNDRAAREALSSLIELDDMLSQEMQRFKLLSKNGTAIDQEKWNRMASVREKHAAIMEGLRTQDHTAARHLLIVYADAVQDLMSYIHGKKH